MDTYISELQVSIVGAWKVRARAKFILALRQKEKNHVGVQSFRGWSVPHSADESESFRDFNDFMLKLLCRAKMEELYKSAYQIGPHSADLQNSFQANLKIHDIDWEQSKCSCSIEECGSVWDGVQRTLVETRTGLILRS